MYYRSYSFSNQKIISKSLLNLCSKNGYIVYGVYHPENSYDILKSNNEFVKDAKQNNLWNFIRGFSINVIDPGKNNFIHIDPWFDGFSRYRFIFPIDGTKGTSVAFYESDRTPDQEIYIKNNLDTSKTFKYFSNEDQLKEIDRVSTETPTVIDTQTLHSARNPSDRVRIIAMIGLDESYDIHK